MYFIVNRFKGHHHKAKRMKKKIKRKGRKHINPEKGETILRMRLDKIPQQKEGEREVRRMIDVQGSPQSTCE